MNAKTTAEELYQLSKDAPSQPVSNYAFRNKGGLQFEKVSKKWGFDTPSFSSGMAYGDLDNDGDLDIVINNMEQPAFVYENKAVGNFLKIKLKGANKNKFGFGAKAIIHHNSKLQIAENTITRGFFSSVEPGLFFGLGKDIKVKMVEVIWPDGKVNYFENVSANKTITAYYSKAKLKIKEPVEIETLLSKIDAIDIGLDYIHKENEFNDFKEEILLPHKLSINGPFSATADVNGDNLDDVFIGGAAQQEGVLFLQTKEGKFQKSLSNPWSKDKDSEDLEALFFDLDGDGDNDLYVASGGSEFKSGNKLLKDRVYINDGVGNFSKSLKIVPEIYESSQTVEASDIDGDGICEILTADYGGGDPYLNDRLNNLMIYKYNKTLDKFELFFSSNEPTVFFNFGRGATNIKVRDLNNDGIMDILVAGEDPGLRTLEVWNGNINGTFDPNWSMVSNTAELGFVEPFLMDADNDGFLDNPLGKQLNVVSRWQYTNNEKGWVSFFNFKFIIFITTDN